MGAQGAIKMGKVVKYADPHFKENLAKHMALVNKKPIGKELEALLKKYEDDRDNYIKNYRGELWEPGERVAEDNEQA
jgi:hypothetical protein